MRCRAEMRRRIRRGLLPAMLLAACGALAEDPPPADAGAQRAATQPAAGAPARRPSGPVTVTADRAEWQNQGLMVYLGRVRVSADGLLLQGSRVALRQLGDGRWQATVTGAPARAEHGADGAPPLQASAQRIVYDSATGELEMSGEVVLRRGGDELRGERILYSVGDRRIRADGGEGGQVRITIQPREDGQP